MGSYSPSLPLGPLSLVILAFLATEQGPASLTGFLGCRLQGSHQSTLPRKCEKSNLPFLDWNLCLLCFSLRAAACVMERALDWESETQKAVMALSSVPLGRTPGTPAGVSSKSFPAPSSGIRKTQSFVSGTVQTSAFSHVVIMILDKNGLPLSHFMGKEQDQTDVKKKNHLYNQ